MNDLFLKNVKYLLTTSSMDEMPKDDLKEVLVIGKSNVGKSTFINLLTNNKKLAKISSKPGKTKAISFFDVDGKFRLVDLPGYGYANVSKQQLNIFAKTIDNFLLNRRNIDKIIFLLDMRRELSQNDFDILNFFLRLKMNFIIIGTKLDKCNQSEVYKFNKMIEKKLGTTPLNYSAVSKKGLKDLITIFNEYLK